MHVWRSSVLWYGMLWYIMVYYVALNGSQTAAYVLMVRQRRVSGYTCKPSENTHVYPT